MENKKEKAFLSPLPSFRPFWPKPHAPFWAEAQLAGSLPPLSLWRLTGGAHSSDPPPSSNRPPSNLPLSAKPPRPKPPLPRSPLPAPRSLSWRAPRARAFSPSPFSSLCSSRLAQKPSQSAAEIAAVVEFSFGRASSPVIPLLSSVLASRSHPSFFFSFFSPRFSL